MNNTTSIHPKWPDTIRSKRLIIVLLLLLGLFALQRANAQTKPVTIDINTEQQLESKIIFELKVPVENATTETNTLITTLHLNSPELSVINIKKLVDKKSTGSLRNYYVAEFTKADKAQAIIALLKSNTMVGYVEQSYRLKLSYVPNDPDLTAAWHLGKINASTAWDISAGNSTVTVAIIDNYFNINHEDLQANVYTNPGEISGNGIDEDNNLKIDDVHGWDFSNNDNDVVPPASMSGCYSADVFSHGTHIAGVIAGTIDNNKGVPSLSRGNTIKYLPLKCAPDNDTYCGAGLGAVEVLQAIDYAIDLNVDVISMSFGIGFYDPIFEQLMVDAHDAGIILVAAAGNDGQDWVNRNINPGCIMYPAGYVHVISVGATDGYDVIAPFSNYGSALDVLAPGVDIYSTSAISNTDYLQMSGTSMATPIVSGLCGLMLSYDNTQTPEQIERCLKSSCTNIYALNPGSQYVNKLGAGRIDAGAAMQCLSGKPNLEITSNFQSTCINKSIQFATRKLSGSNVSSYQWTFAGGTPSSSTVASPIVTYGAVGDYAVSLTVTYAGGGSYTYTMPAYVHVKTTQTNYSNKVDNNWYFGNRATAVHFENGVARGDNDGIITWTPNGREGYATMNSKDGQLLFYTDGVTVWNRHHQVMLNGSGIGGDPSSTQSALIVPEPGDCKSRYYIFTSKNSVKYTTVDMNGDNGLGAVDPTAKGIALLLPAYGFYYPNAEKLAATFDCNGKDVWVVSHTATSNIFYAISVTENFSSSCFIQTSTVGNWYGTLSSPGNAYVAGQMKFSPLGDRLAVAIYGVAGQNQIFSFDKATGIVSNPIAGQNVGTSSYGCEFSPDGRYVYTAGSTGMGNGIYRRDLTGTNTGMFTLPSDVGFTSFELGPDGNIYFQNRGFGTLNCGYTNKDQREFVGIIENPSSATPTINFKKLFLKGDYADAGLANGFISKSLNAMQQFALNLPEKKYQCTAGPITISSNYTGGGTPLYQWYSDAAGLLPGKTASSLTVSSPGVYKLVATLPNGCVVYASTEVIQELTSVDLGPDKCISYPLTLDAGSGYASYLWSTGATSQTIPIAYNGQGNYSVTVTSAHGCQATDDVNITAGESCCIKSDIYNSFLKSYKVPDQEFLHFLPEAKLQLGNGDIVVTGICAKDGVNGLFVMRTNSTGQVLWRKRYLASISQSYFVHDIKESNNGFVIATNNSNGLLFEIDNNGNILWSNKLSYSNSHIVAFERATANNGYIVLSMSDAIQSLIATKVDNLGNQLYSTKVQIPSKLYLPSNSWPGEWLQTNLIRFDNNYAASLSIYNNQGAANEYYDNTLFKITDNNTALTITTVKSLYPYSDDVTITRLLATSDGNGNAQLGIIGTKLTRPFSLSPGNNSKAVFMKLDRNFATVLIEKYYETAFSANNTPKLAKQMLDVVERRESGTLTGYVFAMSEGSVVTSGPYIIEYPVLFSSDINGIPDNIISNAEWTEFNQYNLYQSNGSVLHTTPENGYSLLCPHPNTSIYYGGFDLLKTDNAGFISGSCSKDVEALIEGTHSSYDLNFITVIQTPVPVITSAKDVAKLNFRLEFGCCGPYEFSEPDPCVGYNPDFDFVKDCTSDKVKITFNTNVTYAKVSGNSQSWEFVNNNNALNYVEIPLSSLGTGSVNLCIDLTNDEGCSKVVCKTFNTGPEVVDTVLTYCTLLGRDRIWWNPCESFAGSAYYVIHNITHNSIDYDSRNDYIYQGNVIHGGCRGDQFNKDQTYEIEFFDANGCVVKKLRISVQELSPSEDPGLALSPETVPCGTVVNLEGYVFSGGYTMYCGGVFPTDNHEYRHEWQDANGNVITTPQTITGTTEFIFVCYDMTSCTFHKMYVTFNVIVPSFSQVLRINCIMEHQCVTLDVLNDPLFNVCPGPKTLTAVSRIDLSTGTSFTMVPQPLMEFCSGSQYTLEYTSANGCKCIIIFQVKCPWELAPPMPPTEENTDDQTVNKVSSTDANQRKLTSINDPSSLLLSGIDIYPNPSTGMYTITYTQKVSANEPPMKYDISVQDANGKIVYSRTGLSANVAEKINLSSCASGVYIAKIISGNTVNFMKMIKN